MINLTDSFIQDNVIIPFDTKWKKIAVSLSGGADSALLAFLLCNKIDQFSLKTEVHIISHNRCWKTKPWQQYDSLEIYKWLEKRFINIKFKRHVNFIPPDLEWGDKGATIKDEYNKLVSGDIIELRAFAEYIGYHEKIDAYFNAVTRNPKNVNFKGMTARDIDPTKDNEHLEIMMHMNVYACHPFRFVEKAWVVKQYINLKVKDLFDLTRSCEGVFENINYQTYKPGQYVPVCNNCFWCKEREWAIEQNK